VQATPSQQAWPAEPHVPQLPAAHRPPAVMVQVEPEAMQRPVLQHPPLRQLFPAQQGCPGPPQGRQPS